MGQDIVKTGKRRISESKGYYDQGKAAMILGTRALEKGLGQLDL
jgi:hypothetical protein